MKSSTNNYQKYWIHYFDKLFEISILYTKRVLLHVLLKKHPNQLDFAMVDYGKSSLNSEINQKIYHFSLLCIFFYKLL